VFLHEVRPGPASRSYGLQVARLAGLPPEHMRWRVGNIVFATLNVPGPDNHRRMPEESKPRTAAAVEWIGGTFEIARKLALPGVVIALHANPFTGNPGFREIMNALSNGARGYRGNVLVVHGDTHRFRFDRPLARPGADEPLPNVQRLEVFGSPFVDWVYVTVRVEDGLARFEVMRGSDKAMEQ
jgi:hypothetical protein